MQTYVVIDIRRELESQIQSFFDDADRCKASDEVRFVRSPRLTSSEVVSSGGYDGVAARQLVQKLAAWERSR